MNAVRSPAEALARDVLHVLDCETGSVQET